MTSSPYDDEHLDCGCPECRAKLPQRSTVRRGVPGHIKEELARLRATWRAQAAAEREQQRRTEADLLRVRRQQRDQRQEEVRGQGL